FAQLSYLVQKPPQREQTWTLGASHQQTKLLRISTLKVLHRPKPKHVQIEQRQPQLFQAVAFMSRNRDDSAQGRQKIIPRQQRRKQQPTGIRIVCSLLQLIQIN